MEEFSLQELRTNTETIVEEAGAGSPALITRNGEPVAELHPLSRNPKSARELVDLARSLPRVDVHAFRRDIDQGIKGSITKT